MSKKLPVARRAPEISMIEGIQNAWLRYLERRPVGGNVERQRRLELASDILTLTQQAAHRAGLGS
ncbi:MAG: hypothetical protein EOO40_02515 [Deltaproteobacteria bacterium]|nr:MAG: hypothetical protein EOO40_02515 [Deltaproteobacteria bacterium]